MSNDWRANPYLLFQVMDGPADARTKRWAVRSRRSGDVLGLVSWYGPWRQYTFESAPDCVFNVGCLEAIAGFLFEANADHRAQLRAARG